MRPDSLLRFRAHPSRERSMMVASGSSWARSAACTYARWMSGVRSVVHMLTDLDVQRLDRIRWCPVQFQAFVDGVDVRVHTVGETVFAARITSWATDYRYGDRFGAPPATVEPYALDDDLAVRCVTLARDLDLELAGIDLRITPEGEAVCFEVNPSPAFSYYEQRAGLPIAAALALRLA